TVSQDATRCSYPGPLPLWERAARWFDIRMGEGYHTKILRVAPLTQPCLLMVRSCPLPQGERAQYNQLVASCDTVVLTHPTSMLRTARNPPSQRSSHIG